MRYIYNQLSEDYNTLFLDNILKFKRKLEASTSGITEYVDFYPSFGIKKDEKADFLIYGQAVNGWGTGFTLHHEFPDKKLLQSIKYSNEVLTNYDLCPLDWVNVLWSNATFNHTSKDKLLEEFYKNNYRAHRSFFWNVVYKLSNRVCAQFLIQWRLG